MRKSEILKNIARNVERYPDCVAVRYKEEKLTYSELWKKAQCLAKKIGDICCEEIIGISVSRNINFVVGVLAIWMSDGAYMPLDFSLPEKRIEYIVKKAGIKKYIASADEDVKIRNVEIIRYDSSIDRKELSIDTLNSSLAYVMSTSGSTGMPKLVAIQHQSVMSFLKAYSGVVSVKNRIIGSSVCPFYFDVSVFELFRPLVSGGTVVILDDNVAKNPIVYKEALIRYKITSAYFPPFILNDLADLVSETKNNIWLESILVGVESIPQDTLQKWRNLFPTLNIINGYGPTETTVCATFYVFESLNDTQKITPIGKALDGWQVEIIDEELKPVDDGKVGEIVIAGKGLMRDYIGLESGNTAVIEIHSISCDKGIENRWYRTGDLAYKNKDGDIVFCGRKDEQVKINGVRIDLGEIQNVLLANDKVNSVVICTPELESGKRMFVFVESNETTEEIKGYLERFIPKYMFPTRLISMAKFPVTSNGKVDRKKLLEMSRERMTSTAFIQPRSNIEIEIAKIWCDLLGIDEIGINDDFYELGGDSRLALLAAIRVVEFIDGNLEISKLLVCKTISDVAETLMHDSAELERVVPKSAKSYIELSDGQKGIWTYQKNHMDDNSFVMPIIVKFSKVKNYDLLLERLHIILNKYKVFSMHIELKENTLVWKENTNELLTEVDLVISEDNLEKEILKHFQEEITYVTKLDERIAKAFIAKTDRDNYVLILLVHHIGIDGESANILYEDISRNIFLDNRVDLNEVCFSATQYINQYEDYISSQSYKEDSLFWKKFLAKNITSLEISKNKTKESDNIYPIYEIPLSKDRMRAVYRLKKMLNVTDFEAFFSIIYLLIYAIYQKDNYAISTPTSLRYMDMGLKNDVGYYVNLLPITTNINNGMMLENLVITIANSIRECRVHGRYPFERIVEDLLIERRINSSNALTSIVVAEDVNNYELFSGDLCDASVLNISKKSSIYNLTFFVKLKVNNPSVRIEYDSTKYTISDICFIEKCMNKILDKITETGNCSIYELCSAITKDKIERKDVFIEAVQRNTRMPQDDLISLFKDIVRDNSKKIALEEESGLTITYGELDKLSDQIAYHILNSGCKGNESILLVSKRNAEFIIRVLGVLKANCSYIPIDDKVPVYRVKQIARQANVKRFLVAKDYSNQEKAAIQEALTELNCVEIECELESSPVDIYHKRNMNQAAYVMFTSGSTGKPKGVIVPDRGIIRLAKYPNFVNLTKSDVFILMSNISFDAATFEIWGTLLNGGKLYIPNSRIMNSPKLLLDRIWKKGITVGFINVTMFRWILEENIKALANMHTILVGGEIVPPKLFIEASKYLSFDKLVNGYGPTENTTFTCCYRLKTNPIGMKHIPVGYSLEYSSTLVVDENMNVVPDGVEGEIIVSGAGVALGYIGDKEETTKVFIDLGKERGVWYKTGDIGVVQPDQSIVCLGRKDNQVKIRGFRIEIDEIESVFSSIKGVRDVAVLVKDAIEGKRLEAYVVSNMQEQEIKTALKEKIPDYMIPSKIYIIDEMPTNEHGKKNRKKLSKIGEKMKQKNSDAKEKVNNQISIEKINSIFSEYLGVNEIDAKTRFFDMGFNSLLIAMIATTISKEYHLDVSSLDIIEHPTLTDFYAWLCEESNIVTDKNDEIAEIEKEACQSQDIAVIGMFGRFPGCNNVDELWNHSIEGRIDVSSFETASNKEIGVRGIIADTDRFDAKYFGVTHRDAELMDPQQRVLLEVCQCAFDDAAIDVSSVNGPISVYATSAANEDEEKSDSLSEQYEKMLVTSSDLIAMQISYRLNLRGESVTVQTGCSSSMIAVSMACQSLLSNKAYISLAAGVSFPTVQEKGYYYEEGMITSKTGKCRPFDIMADGTIPGSGAAAVVLMRKEDAITINAPIYAVIKAISSNNDGASKVGFMAPSAKGQEEVIREAHKLANVEPSEIEYVETHGTATKLGDAIEVKALAKLFTQSEAHCAIGSIKANIGHLDRASGITGLIRTVKAVNSGIIPPMAGFTEENPDLHLNDTGLYVPREKTEWKNKTRRIAGVSSFGVGGTNVHAIVESFNSDNFDDDTRKNYIIPMSSHQSSTLNSQKNCLCDYLKQNSTVSIKDVSATLIKGRADQNYRTFFVADSNDSLLNEMCSTHETVNSEGERKVIWVFPGSGDKELDGFVEMYGFSNVYREALDECISIIEKYVDIDVRRILFSHSSEIKKSLKDNNVFQPVMFAIQWAHVSLWRSLGYEPDVVMGHSLGEVMAATVAGVFSLEDAVRVVIWRSEFMHSNSPEGIVLSVNMSSAEIQKLLPENTFVAVDNGKSLVAVSGDVDSVASLKEHLDSIGVKSRYLMINRIVHSPMMKHAAEKLIKKIDSIQIRKAKIPVVSNVYGKVTNSISTSNYWGQHLCNMVKFRESLDFIANEYPNGAIFVVGPGKSIAAMISNEIEDRMSIVYTIANRNPEKVLLYTVGLFWQYGIENDLESKLKKLYNQNNLYDDVYNLLHLPVTVFDHSHKWNSKQLGIINNYKKQDEKVLTREHDYGAWIWRYDFEKIEFKKDKPISSNSLVIYDVPEEGTYEFGALKSDSNENLIWVVNENNTDIFNKAFILRKKLNKHNVWLCPLENNEEKSIISNTQICRAILKCITLEIPNTNWHLVKGFMNLKDVDAGIVNAIANEGIAPEVIQINNGEVLSERMVHSWPGFKPKQLRDNGLYVITGGTGRVAKSLIQAIGNLVSATIILIGRSVLNEKVVECSDTKNKVVTRYIPLDITNQSAVNDLFNRLRVEYGRIDGVIHAAAQTNTDRFQLLGKVTEERMNEITAAKIKGCINIDNALLETDADFIILCSSLSNELGGVGFSSYITANLYLNEFAKNKYSEGDTRWISVEWDAWTDAEETNKSDKDDLKLAQFALDDTDGVNIFPFILATPEPVISVSTADVKVRRNHSIEMLARLSDDETHLGDNNLDYKSIVLGILQNSLGEIPEDYNQDLKEKGLESLSILQIIGKIRKATNKQLALGEVMNDLSVNGLLKLLNHDAEKDEDFRVPFEMSTVDHREMYPVSSTQRRWLLLMPEMYGGLDLVVKVTGNFEKTRFYDAVEKVVMAHSGIRTRFPYVNGDWVQVVENETNIKEIDLTDFSELQQKEILKKIVEENTEKWFDVENKVPFELILARISSDEYAMIIHAHHVLFDGTSSSIFMRDIARAMAGKKVEPEYQYIDYAVNQYKYVNGKDIIPYREFWTKHFMGAKFPLAIPGDIECSVVDDYGDFVKFVIDKEMLKHMRENANRRGVTIFNIMMAAFGLLLQKKTNENDLVIGTTVAGRPTVDTENIIGVFVNPLPLRLTVDCNMELDAYVEYVKNLMIDFHDNSHYPMEDLTKFVNPFIGLGLNDTFQAYILYQNYWRPEETNMSFEKIDVGATTHHKLMREYELVLEEHEHELIGEFWYKTSKYTANTIQKDADIFIDYVKQIINQ